MECELKWTQYSQANLLFLLAIMMNTVVPWTTFPVVVGARIVGRLSGYALAFMLKNRLNPI